MFREIKTLVRGRHLGQPGYYVAATEASRLGGVANRSAYRCASRGSC